MRTRLLRVLIGVVGGAAEFDANVSVVGDGFEAVFDQAGNDDVKLFAVSVQFDGFFERRLDRDLLVRKLFSQVLADPAGISIPSQAGR